MSDLREGLENPEIKPRLYFCQRCRKEITAYAWEVSNFDDPLKHWWEGKRGVVHWCGPIVPVKEIRDE